MTDRAGGEAGGTAVQDERELPEQVRMGLLAYIGAHTVDEDYAYVSERRRATEPGRHGTAHRRRIGVLGAVVLAVFGVLAVTAGSQTSREAGDVRRQQRDLAGQLADVRTTLERDQERVATLQRDTRRLESDLLAGDASAAGVLRRVDRLGVLAGTRAVQGEGVRLRVDDAPGADSARNRVLDSDLQRLVNALWAAGAEAVSINGQRLSSLSAIRLAGSAITVNYRSLSRPYVISAIGDKDALPARFAETASGRAWLDVQDEVGLRFSITPVSALRLPPADVGTLRHATVPRSSTARQGGSR